MNTQALHCKPHIKITIIINAITMMITILSREWRSFHAKQLSMDFIPFIKRSALTLFFASHEQPFPRCVNANWARGCFLLLLHPQIKWANAQMSKMVIPVNSAEVNRSRLNVPKLNVPKMLIIWFYSNLKWKWKWKWNTYRHSWQKYCIYATFDLLWRFNWNASIALFTLKRLHTNQKCLYE